VLGLALVAIPLYLWRRPRSESLPVTSMLDASAPLSDAGLAVAAASPAAAPTLQVTLSEAKVMECHDPGSRHTAPADCDHLAPLEKGLAAAITSAGACMPSSVGGGTLVYVVDVGQGKQCNGDDSHVHLQVEVTGSIYDVAVDIGTAPNDEVGYYEETLAVPGGAWAEGWHGADTLAYPSLGLHSTSFPTTDPATVGAQVEALLASTTKISIFCKGYPQGNGCHDVHYEDGTGEDGAIVLDPTAAMSPVLFFRFSTQTF